MTKEELLKEAKAIITEELEKAGFKVVEIILFGSRARGDEREDSDWDFYVVVDKEIDFKTKMNVTMWIRRRLVKLNISSDILVQSSKVVKERENDCGFLTYYVIREGKYL